MNANDQFFARDAQVDAAAVAPLPASQKIYVQGSRSDIRVPMREITQSETPASFGAERNPPLAVYDTSGPYTDPSAKIDIRRGLPALRGRGSQSATTRSNSTARRQATGAHGWPTRRWRVSASTSRAHRGALRAVQMSPRCTTHAAAPSHRKWNSLRSART